MHIGVIVFDKVDNSQSHSEIVALLRQTEQFARDKYQTAQRSEIPEIKCWREAYKQFNAKEYTSSVEALLKRAVKGEAIWDINDLVNLYNALSLKYLLPFGGEDLDAMTGDLELTVSAGGEECQLLGDAEPSVIKPGEVLYRDAVGPVCRRWNWREVERTKLTKETRRAIIVCEDLVSDGPDLCRQAMAEFLEISQKYLKAEGSVSVRSK